MIPIVEDYLSDLIQTKLDYLRDNSEIVGKILGTSPDRLERLARYLKATPIKVTKGYPRTPAELPSICILLSNEDESQEGLGDYGSMDGLDNQENTQELVVLGDSQNNPFIRVSNVPIESIVRIVHNGLGYELNPYEYSVTNSDLGLVELEHDSVDIGDSLTVTYMHSTSSMEVTQVLYDATYRLEVWTLNGDFTVELYHLLKWIMLAGRDHLGKDKDLFRQKLSGADFQPVPKYFPEFVYRRALTFWCQFTASAVGVGEEVSYISAVVTDQTEYSKGFSGGDST